MDPNLSFIRRGGLPSLLLLVGICICSICPPISAATISFDDLTLVADQGVELYLINGTGSELIGVYNTSSTGIFLDDGASYVAVLRPTKSERWSDPATLTTDIVNWAGDHAFGIGTVALLVLVLLTVGRNRGGGR